MKNFVRVALLVVAGVMMAVVAYNKPQKVEQHHPGYDEMSDELMSDERKYAYLMAYAEACSDSDLLAKHLILQTLKIRCKNTKIYNPTPEEWELA